MYYALFPLGYAKYISVLQMTSCNVLKFNSYGPLLSVIFIAGMLWELLMKLSGILCMRLSTNYYLLFNFWFWGHTATCLCLVLTAFRNHFSQCLKEPNGMLALQHLTLCTISLAFDFFYFNIRDNFAFPNTSCDPPYFHI